MKTKITTVVILSLLFLKTFSQDSKATLDEAISWIEGKLDYFDNDPIVPTDIKVVFDKKTKTLKYTRKFHDDNHKIKQYFIDYIPIKDINPSNIKISQDNGTFWVYLYTNDKKRIIKSESWFTNEDPNKKLILNEYETFFKIPKSEIEKNPDLADRLKKAIIHLIKLSGGKGETF